MVLKPCGFVNSNSYENYLIIDSNLNTKILDFRSADGVKFTANLGLKHFNKAIAN
jgi:hypothetical protein